MSKTLEDRELRTHMIEIPSYHIQKVQKDGRILTTQGERVLAEFLKEQLENCGCRLLEVAGLPEDPMRANLYAVRGTGTDYVTLFTGHLDTVPGKTTYTEHNGRAYGRGVWDMLGGIEALITAFRNSITPRGHTHILALFADEEGQSRGVLHFLRQILNQELKIPNPHLIIGPEINAILTQYRNAFNFTIGRCGHLKEEARISTPPQHAACPSPGALDVLAMIHGATAQHLKEICAEHPQQPTSIVWNPQIQSYSGAEIGFPAAQIKYFDVDEVEGDMTVLSSPNKATGKFGCLFGLPHTLADMNILLQAHASLIKDAILDTQRSSNHPELIPYATEDDNDTSYEIKIGPRDGVTHYEPYRTKLQRHIRTIYGLANLIGHNRHGQYSVQMGTDRSPSDMGFLQEFYPEAACIEVGPHGGNAHGDDEYMELASRDPLVAFYEDVAAGKHLEKAS